MEHKTRYRARVMIHAMEKLGEPRETLSAAIADCQHEISHNGAKFAAVDRDQGGKDHPDNAGKFFLYQFVKA